MDPVVTTGILGSNESDSIEILQRSISFFMEQTKHVEAHPEEENWAIPAALSSCFVNTRSVQDTTILRGDDVEDEHCRWLVDRNAVLGAKQHNSNSKSKATKIASTMQDQNMDRKTRRSRTGKIHK